MTEMQAWQMTDNSGVEGLSLVQLPLPSPGSGELLVKVHSTALNFSDLLMLEGKYQIRPPLPYTPGQEIAGTVVQAAPDTAFEPGQRIASKVQWGGFAEYVLVRDDMAIRVGDFIPLTVAVALPVVYTTAMVALTDSTCVRPGEVVLIHGAAGGVGLAAVEIAHALGAYVIGVAGSDEKCALVREHGADLALNHQRDDWVQIVRGINDGKRADVIFDPVGGEVTTNSLHCLAREGRLLIVGFASGTIPQIPAHRLLLKRVKAIGVYWDHDYDGDMLRQVTNGLLGLYEQGQIRPVVYPYGGLEALPEALSDLAGRRLGGKLILTLDAA